MPELKTDTSDNPSAPTPAPPTAGQDQSDALMRLHKMSTTAGLGQDYVAINGLAVTAFLLGLASALALLDNILLVIPAAGVVCGLVAVWQIRRSSGTQTGLGFAWAGLVLSVGLAALVLVQQVVHAQRTRADERQIAALIGQLEQHVKQAEWEQAYGLFSERFRQRVGRAEFTERFSVLRSSPYYGELQSVDWTRRLVFQVDPNTGGRVATGMVIMEYDGAAAPARHEVHFRRRGQEGWVIEDMPMVFPAVDEGDPF